MEKKIAAQMAVMCILALSFAWAELDDSLHEIVYDNTWRVGMTHTIFIATTDDYEYGRITITQGNETIADDVLYQLNRTTFQYNHYVPLNSRITDYDVRITLEGDPGASFTLGIGLKDLNALEKAWVFLTTHLPFLR
jgi:hypothetical protein